MLRREKFKDYLETKEATVLIKKCNDFGAGGVSVAIGELARSFINLNKVPTKYTGLSGTELAISESQKEWLLLLLKKTKKNS